MREEEMTTDERVRVRAARVAALKILPIDLEAPNNPMIPRALARDRVIDGFLSGAKYGAEELGAALALLEEAYNTDYLPSPLDRRIRAFMDKQRDLPKSDGGE